MRGRGGWSDSPPSRSIDVLDHPALVAVVTAPVGDQAVPYLPSVGVDEIQPTNWGGGLG
jgi:hypothetical protein